MDSVDSAGAFGTSAAFGSIDADLGIWVRAPFCDFSQDGNSPKRSFSRLGSFSTTQDCVDPVRSESPGATGALSTQTSNGVDADLGTSTVVGWACLLQPTDKKTITASPLRSNVPAVFFLPLEHVPNGANQHSQIEYIFLARKFRISSFLSQFSKLDVLLLRVSSIQHRVSFLLHTLSCFSCATQNVQLMFNHIFDGLSAWAKVFTRVKLTPVFSENLPDFRR